MTTGIRSRAARLALALLLFAAPLPASAQDSPAPEPAASGQPGESGARPVLDLDSLVEEALQNNPSVRAAFTAADAAATRPRQLTALPDPTVSAGYRPFAIGGVDGFVPPQLMVEQMIPYPGKLELAGRAASYAADMAAHDAEAMRLDVAYAVRETYYELFRIQEQDGLIREFQGQLRRFEEAAAVKYEVGAGTQQAILKAQLEQNTLARRQLEIAASRRELIERLARLTHRPSLAASLDPVLVRPDLAAAGQASPEEAMARRPEVAALEAGIDMADTEVDRARKEYRPDFMVGVGFMDMAAMNGGVEPLKGLASRFGIEAGLVIPLQRGKRDAAVEEARLRRTEYAQRLDALRTEIQTELNALLAQLEQDRRALALYRASLIPQAETTLEATLSAYTTGRTDFLDLLDAERMLFELKMDYEDTYAGYLKTRAALDRTAGIEAPAQSATASIPTTTGTDTTTVQDR